MTRWNFLLVAALAVANHCANAYYVPGVRPEEFKPDDKVKLKVNALTSVHTQIPKEYYRLPFCRPVGGVKMESENLGEFLTGNKIQSSPYEINMLEEMYCKKLCYIELSTKDVKQFYRHIKYDYHNNWIIDNLNSAAIYRTKDKGDELLSYAGGFPIGFLDDKTPYINNHVNINIDYHQFDERTDDYRVVAFAVEPLSVRHKFADGYKWDGKSDEGKSKRLSSCPRKTHFLPKDVKQSQIVKEGEKIIFTYDVIWTQSDVAWTSRWDIYLNAHKLPAKVHWYSISNSIMVVLFLSLLVVSMLVRNLKRDIAAYNSVSFLDDEEADDDQDETGWKLIHADVFRPPDNYPMLFCVCCGGGVQLILTTFITIGFSAIGFLNPARRGSLMNGILSFYVLTGIVSGYTSSRLYKSFKGRLWQVCTVVTALLFPGIAFFLFVFFNIVLFFLHSSASAPFLDIIIVAAMWCCVSVPLVFVGAYFGYKKDAIEFPTVTSTIARAIPEPNFVMSPMFGATIAGVVPFSAAYVELFFIMTSLWMDQYYYVFGFTFVVFIILIITCAEVTLLLVYTQLCAENHRWWWFSFFAPGSTALYTFIYSIFWFKSLEASKMLMTYVLYFGYMGLICSGLFLVTGTVGALSSMWFIKTIFGTIKVD
jgi:transmembrane 9 superfamily protein 2/4